MEAEKFNGRNDLGLWKVKDVDSPQESRIGRRSLVRRETKRKATGNLEEGTEYDLSESRR